MPASTVTVYGYSALGASRLNPMSQFESLVSWVATLRAGNTGLLLGSGLAEVGPYPVRNFVDLFDVKFLHVTRRRRP